jgi:pantoate--beta-alanine ligase
MFIAKTINDLRRMVSAARADGKNIGLVPTMGALHTGHASLIHAARAGCGFVVVSIFVNPTQFGPNEDCARYPRAEQADLAACREAGADAVFMPSVAEMYPTPPLMEVSVGRLGAVLCGCSRPTHFAGVATVVAKLFNIVQPDRAFFGAKDYQQSVIIRAMATELNFPVEIVLCPTIREADGLAMSSRNAYLTPDQRRQAPALSQSLRLADGMIRRDHPPAEAVLAAVTKHLAAQAPLGKVDYAQLVDPQTLEEVSTTSRPILVALAVRFGATRLIDNKLVEG